MTYFFLLPLPVLSLVVVFGCRFTVDCFTNRPVTALRPRLPAMPLTPDRSTLDVMFQF